MQSEGARRPIVLKKFTIFILCLFIIALTCFGCSKTGNSADQVEEVPIMLLGYTVNGKSYEVNVSSGTASWHYEYEDGTGFGVNSDAPHPLDMLGVMPVIDKVDGLKKLSINFTFAPDSYSVRRWIDDYAGNAQEHANDYETVKVSGGAIAISDDEQGYIFEVNAVWPQGNANYAFAVSLS